MADVDEPEPIPDEIPATDAHLEPLNKRQRAWLGKMVWEGLPHQKAAAALGIPDRTSRHWLRQPAIRKAMKAEEHVLRASARAGNIHRLIALRDQDRNLQAAVAAARTIAETEEADQTTSPFRRTPGYVFVIRGPAPEGTPRSNLTIEHEPREAPALPAPSAPGSEAPKGIAGRVLGAGALRQQPVRLSDDDS